MQSSVWIHLGKNILTNMYEPPFQKKIKKHVGTSSFWTFWIMFNLGQYHVSLVIAFGYPIW